jgi:two-component system sensor histidine kinase KdpD
VQHLDSLNQAVGGITGVRVWETVPDAVFDGADEVVLVDLPADELLRRLREGKVYLPEQGRHAARNFFRKGNSIALRELALRRTADRVDDDVRAYRQRCGDRTGLAHARGGAGVHRRAGDAEQVVRSARRLAGQLDCDWHVVTIATPRLMPLADPTACGCARRCNWPRNSARVRKRWPARHGQGGGRLRDGIT